MPLKEGKNPTFFVDAMLGNIAKKLRLMGFDSRYMANIEDDDLIKQAENDKRIIISRDKDLVGRGQKIGIQSILIKNKNEIEQLREVIDELNLKIIKINGDRARCPKCNSKTQSIIKKILKKKFQIKF